MNDFNRGALVALAWARLNTDLAIMNEGNLEKHKEDVNEVIDIILDEQGSAFYTRVLGGKEQQ